MKKDESWSDSFFGGKAKGRLGDVSPKEANRDKNGRFAKKDKKVIELKEKITKTIDIFESSNKFCDKDLDPILSNPIINHTKNIIEREEAVNKYDPKSEDFSSVDAHPLTKGIIKTKKSVNEVLTKILTEAFEVVTQINNISSNYFGETIKDIKKNCISNLISEVIKEIEFNVSVSKNTYTNGQSFKADKETVAKIKENFIEYVKALEKDHKKQYPNETMDHPI